MHLILQHWHENELPPIVRASVINLQAYAKRIGCEYALIIGDEFLPGFSRQAQKLIVFDERWHGFEDVAMVDSDMFATASCPNLFDDPGIGFHQKEAHKRVCRAFPNLTSPTAGFYGGCLYKLTRSERKALQATAPLTFDIRQFDCSAGGWDEGIMHRLCHLAGMPAMYLDPRWCWGSYWPRPDLAFMIHVRPKPTGDKLKNLRTLQASGIIP